MARARKPKKPIVYDKDEAFIHAHVSGPGMIQGPEFEIDADGNFTVGYTEMWPRDFNAQLKDIERRADEKLNELGWPAVHTNAVKERRQAAKRGKNPLAGPHSAIGIKN